MLKLKYNSEELSVLIRTFGDPGENSGSFTPDEWIMVRLVLVGTGKRLLKQLLNSRKLYHVTFSELECVAIAAYLKTIPLQTDHFKDAVLSDIFILTDTACQSISSR